MIISRLIELYSVVFSGLSNVFIFPLLCIAFCVFAFNVISNIVRSITHV